ncbi:MAG: DUF2232 domain-containing protein [Candidatus Electrothrix sp. AR4]|nr:DUF2232 domain-containing protein [Candidatus Electrothrix sp. AR4]
MVKHGDTQQRGISFFFPQALLVALFFFLPLSLPPLLAFAWTIGLLAVPIFFVFQFVVDERKATRQVRNGLLLTVAGALLLNQLSFFVFSLTMLPLGYSLYRSALRQKTPAEVGAEGSLVLGGSWLVFWAVYGVIAGVNPYTSLLAMLDSSLDQITLIYHTSSDLPADVLYNLEQIIAEMREFLPKVLPGLLAGTVILTVWLNMIISGNLLRRLAPNKTCWPQYSCWRLPDKLVWLFIIAVVLSLSGLFGLSEAGYCLVIVSVLLYFFQGAAVFVHILNRWNIPKFFRIIIYIILALQSYGILMLAVAGIADIWADFRKLGQEEQ